jgi:hypothetical protein
MGHRRTSNAPHPAPMPMSIPRIIDAGMLCELRVWTEAEWEALPAGARPARHAHAPGLGWVGAVPRESLN